MQGNLKKVSFESPLIIVNNTKSIFDIIVKTQLQDFIDVRVDQILSFPPNTAQTAPLCWFLSDMKLQMYL